MESFFADILNLKKKFEKVYIYGAGLYGRNIYEILKENDISIDGFIVTKQNKKKELFHLPIYEINKVKQEKNKKISDIYNSKLTPEEKDSKIAEVQIGAVWDIYCKFNGDDISCQVELPKP